MTWVQFRNTVKSLMSDASRNDKTAVIAFAEFVKAYLALWVDRNPALYAGYMKNWELQRDRLLGYSVTLSRDLLRAEVGRLLTVDSSRLGIQEALDDLIATARNDLAGSADFIDAYIVQAVIEIQNYIHYYRRGFERTFTPADTVANGEACNVALPDGAHIQDVYYVKDNGGCQRMPVVQYDWQNRYDLVCGIPKMPSGGGCVPCTGQFYAAIDPKGQGLVLFPALLDGYHLSLFYDDFKTTFLDAERVPFDEFVALAVADYVQARRHIQPLSNDPKTAAIHLEAYRSRRTQLYHDAKEKQRISFTNDSPFLGLCECAICCGSTDGGGGTPPTPTPPACAEVDTVATRAEMKALIPYACRKLVFILTPEPGVSFSYRYVHGDLTEANDISVIAPDAPYADQGRYFEYNLA